ncbi:hypothetical protein R6Q59_026407 [Mikania micrantha]|uniref:Myb-like domain-containing protein n=1 Tax=Mikania micrantha TaxID=192012 RepID=A0A5N6PFY9_9ASTR|nr:hypothetical protein E3N88_11643 [Mikania micrantha]
MEHDDMMSGDRFPQWSVQETRDFLMIRGEMDPTFMETKRNKILWEVISTKMKETGYNRTAHQCRCKWKNLVTRYKGYETMEHEGMRQEFPFFKELQAIFTGRMQRMLWMEAEGGMRGSSSSSKSKKRSVMHQQLSSSSDDDDDEEIGTTYKKNKKKKINKTTTARMGVNLKDILEELMKQQIEIEKQWMKLYESKEEERRRRETEWRRKMEALENEKMMFDRTWRDREEETRIKQETKSEKRDALITLLLNKLTQH